MEYIYIERESEKEREREGNIYTDTQTHSFPGVTQHKLCIILFIKNLFHLFRKYDFLV